MYQGLGIKKEKIFLEMNIHKFIKCCISRGKTRPGIKYYIHGAKLAQAMIGNRGLRIMKGDDTDDT